MAGIFAPVFKVWTFLLLVEILRYVSKAKNVGRRIVRGRGMHRPPRFRRGLALGDSIAATDSSPSYRSWSQISPIGFEDVRCAL